MERINVTLTQMSTEEQHGGDCSRDNRNKKLSTRAFLDNIIGDVDGVTQFVSQEEANAILDLDPDLSRSVQPQNVADYKPLSENLTRKVIFKTDKAKRICKKL